MSRDLMQRYDRQKPWSIALLLLLAALLGSVAVPVQILLAKQSQSASSRQVARNEQIIRNAARTTHNNQRNACLQLNEVLMHYSLPVVACPPAE